MTLLHALSTLLVAATAPLSLTCACLACAPEHTARASTTLAPVDAPAEGSVPTGHYCNMGFFTKEALARHEELIPKIVAAVTDREEIPDGFVFKLSGQFREAGEWLDGVRGCCPTVEYAITFTPRSGPATLRISGSAGAKEFIREEFRPILHPKG
jgi:hypothetical protein